MKRNYLGFAIGLLVLIVSFSSCKSEAEKRLEQSVFSTKIFNHQNQGWKANQIMNFSKEIQYRATEVPISYYLLKNQGMEDVQAFDSIAIANNKERIIEFEFEHIANEDLLMDTYTSRSYDDSVIYMAGTIKDDFYAVTSSNDTIPCLGVHFERHFNVSSFKRVMLYFGGVDPNESIKIVYQDRLFNQGTFEFDFGNMPIKL